MNKISKSDLFSVISFCGGGGSSSRDHNDSNTTSVRYIFSWREIGPDGTEVTGSAFFKKVAEGNVIAGTSSSSSNH